MQLTTNKGMSKSALCLSLIFIATGIERFWGNFAGVPTLVKIIFSSLVYFSFMLYPYQVILKSKREYYKIGYWILILLAAFIFVGLIQALNYKGIINGNKYTTLFFNETTCMILCPPVFAFLAFINQIWQQMWKLFFIYAIYATICLLIGKVYLSCMLVPLIPLFFHHCKGLKKILILFAFSGVLLTGLSGARTYLILVFFITLSIVCYYIKLRSTFLKIFAIFIFILPFGLLTHSIVNQTSVFELMSDYSSDKDLTADTRTFLYMELAEDLTNTDSWLWGKSVIGRYYSPYFSMTDGADSMWRINNEVTILNFLLKAGIIYSLLYLITFIVAIWTAVQKGHNRFIKSIAIMLLGIYFNLFIGDMTGCNLFHLSYWLMIGTCFSKKWLNMTDKEVKAYFNKTSN